MKNIHRASIIWSKAYEAALGVLFCVLLMTACVMIEPDDAARNDRFEFGLIGDLPYTTEDEKKFPNLVQDMNAANLAFVIHDGDFQRDPAGWDEKVGGLPPCSDETIRNRQGLAQSFKHPFIFTPGDNDWTDCHRAKPHAFDPLERLAKIREMFFHRDQTLGQRTIRVTRQNEDSGNVNFPENLRWTYGQVLFVTVHVVGSGSNNNLGRTREMDAEYAERNSASLAWLRRAFALAKRDSNRGIMIITHANLGFQNYWSESRFRRYLFGTPIKRPDEKLKTGYDDFLAALEAETLAFSGPVVLAHGDSHIFRIDKPLVNSRTGRMIENFTRVETFGTPDSHWVRAIVDPNDPNVFSFRPEIVKKNLLDHSAK